MGMSPLEPVVLSVPQVLLGALYPGRKKGKAGVIGAHCWLCPWDSWWKGICQRFDGPEEMAEKLKGVQACVLEKI